MPGAPSQTVFVSEVGSKHPKFPYIVSLTVLATDPRRLLSTCDSRNAQPLSRRIFSEIPAIQRLSAFHVLRHCADRCT